MRPGDRGGDVGVIQVDPRGVCRRLGLQIGGLGVVGVLGRDGVGGQERGIAVGLDLGAGQRRRGAFIGGLIGGGIDLIKRLAFLDVGAFGEKPMQDDAGDLGPHV